ncbi:dihydrofolate reductase family protein [Sphingomicrobium arenosum]|uniref:dihydrofolate reductase family protein n=1 Tax=Sphingomicrobium arenosum TaxID=2233861 RepID=UPI002240F420|nr:dihydrofolate reductase family protein [Sphingomicrobium arenosum]
MRQIHGAAFVSLDGVMQAPGGLSEDPTEGFEHGGWLAPHFDAEIGQTIDTLFGRPFDLLLGRRTYDIFASYWPYVGDEQAAIRDPFNACTKYVLTRGGADLDWVNSAPLADMAAVRALKASDGPDLVIQGSTTLYPQLLAEGLLDRLTLMIFPVVLGSGKRWFGGATPPRTLEPTHQQVTSGGNLIATYDVAGPVECLDVAPPSTSAREAARQEVMASGRW